MEAQLRKNEIHLCSLESQIPLKQFDIIGFSLLYELNYTNMVNMLDLGDIPFWAAQRKENDAIIIAGGPCTCNPEPVADFFDAIVVGDGEVVLLEMTSAWLAWRRSENRRRNELLQRWSRIKGVYIPSFFNIFSDAAGNQRLKPKQNSYPHVDRAYISDLNDAPSPTKPIIPFGKPIHDRLRMEIARGCTRGCRFCQAGMIYRPVRERRPELVLSSAIQSLKETGYEDLSLLSLSTGDYSCISPLMKKIMEFGQKDRIAVSLPSLRAGSLTPEIMELVRKVRKTGFTIAPEAGSQRLRDVINKNITEADIVETITNAFSLGWKIIKLYFMVGLPTETQADLEAIVEMVKRLKKLTKQHGRSAKINVSITTFVPKPHTPFQWEPQISLESGLQKINWLKANLNLPGVHMKWQDPRVSMIEGVFARGDRKLNRALINAWKSGCRFDGWTDSFNYDRWIRIFEDSDINPNYYIGGCAHKELNLPWDHIHIGVDRSFLLEERERALKGKLTKDCRTGSCSSCGVCDFDSLKPISFHDQPSPFLAETPADDREISEITFKYSVFFKKVGIARFFGHLEMVKIFTRSLRRERIPLKYSNGFHPMPKISFGDTLPMGMQSEDEKMTVTLTEAMNPEELILRLRRQLPEGLDITGCSPYVRQKESELGVERTYLVELKDGFLMQKDLDWFFVQQSVTIDRKSKKGKLVVVDLKKAVSEIRLLDNQHVSMTLGKDNNLMVRPAQVMKTIFNLTEQQIITAVITKRKANHV
jgi:radical SAM family uncharacterized protein/radical SAM-linked protein